MGTGGEICSRASALGARWTARGKGDMALEVVGPQRHDLQARIGPRKGGTRLVSRNQVRAGACPFLLPNPSGITRSLLLHNRNPPDRRTSPFCSRLCGGGLRNVRH